MGMNGIEEDFIAVDGGLQRRNRVADHILKIFLKADQVERGHQNLFAVRFDGQRHGFQPRMNALGDTLVILAVERNSFTGRRCNVGFAPPGKKFLIHLHCPYWKS
ncbi:hypothetical protein SDC9_153870 [bioreactor metagenome]|uniref:Uncharacterized protein n=1 Tax=bioreactor metagenome TaxID=1076179 RepID=A0A645F1W8_9ZZZZ